MFNSLILNLYFKQWDFSLVISLVTNNCCKYLLLKLYKTNAKVWNTWFQKLNLGYLIVFFHDCVDTFLGFFYATAQTHDYDQLQKHTGCILC